MIPPRKRALLLLSFCCAVVLYYYRHIHQPAVKVDSVVLKPIPRYSATEIFSTYFPQCYIPSNHSWIIWLQKYGRYVPTTQPARYDHWCPVMKARYNCAWPPNTTNPPQQAFQFEFVWNHPHHSDVCSLRRLWEFIGGPANLSQRQILLQGNSYLRQIWEALVCGYQHPTTHLTLYKDGPPTSMAYIQSRRGKLITPRELGDFVVDAHHIQGCHGPSSRTPLETYYRPNVSIPPNLDKCSDDMAMVKFGDVQFTFIFHPSRYHSDALTQAYRNLGIAENMPVDTMVWMGTDETMLRNLTAQSRIDLGPLLPLLIQIQNQSLGQYFGADNPWITNPPDNHPCMPGIPDDEAQVLLFLLLLQEYQMETATKGKEERRQQRRRRE